MAIGRLDEKSEGLLLLTTNGKYSEYIRSAKVKKTYAVMVDGIITDTAIRQLQEGVTITVNQSAYTTKPCDAERLNNISFIPERFVREDRHGPTSWICITITEGKFRQVRKMTAKVGYPTLRLVRIQIGDFSLNNLGPGEFRPIFPEGFETN